MCLTLFTVLARAGSKDGETGLNVEPAKARETEAFLHEVSLTAYSSTVSVLFLLSYDTVF